MATNKILAAFRFIIIVAFSTGLVSAGLQKNSCSKGKCNRKHASATLKKDSREIRKRALFESIVII